MKPAVRLMSTITTVWTLFVFIIVALMVLPVIPGVVTVELPEPEDWDATVTNEAVHMSSNISVRNGGLFPFTDFSFVIALYGNNATPLVEFSSNRTDLQPNTWVNIPISFSINKSEIGESKLQTMVFDRLTFGGLIYFNTRYLLDFRAQLGISGNISLGPLIRGLDYDINRTTITSIGGNSTLNIPFSLNSSRLEGRNISISGTISNGTQVLGAFNHSFAPGQQGQDNLTVNLTPEAYDHLVSSSDHLVINGTVTFDDFVWNYQNEREWHPPPGG
jgi:hypothetical protein